MAIKKVIFGDRTLIDLSADTVTADKLCPGYTAHQANGEIIIGSLTNSPISPYIVDFNKGYINEGTWYYEYPSNNLTDIYQVTANHKYCVIIGGIVSTRFRVMFTETDVSQVTEDITGISILNRNNPNAHDNVLYTALSDGYLIIGKTNNNRTGIKTYVYDATVGWL